MLRPQTLAKLLMFPTALNKEEKDVERLFLFHSQEYYRAKLTLFVKPKLICISRNDLLKQIKRLTTPQTLRRKTHSPQRQKGVDTVSYPWTKVECFFDHKTLCLKTEIRDSPLKKRGGGSFKNDQTVLA